MRGGRKPSENSARIFSIFTSGRTKSGPKNDPGFRSQNWDRNPGRLIVFVYKLKNRGPNFGTGIRARFWDRILVGGPDSGANFGTGIRARFGGRALLAWA